MLCGGDGLVAKSCLTLATPWSVVLHAPLSIGFSRQEYWSVLPFPSPGDLPNLGIKPWSPALQADSLPTELPVKPPVLCGQFLLVICFTLCGVYMSIPVSQSISLSPSHLGIHTFVLYVCVSISALSISSSTSFSWIPHFGAHIQY